MAEINARNRQQAWYASWFDSPYYPLLYRHRDEAEAAHFIAALCQYLQPEPGSTALDLACGRGRHALVMAREGLRVTGLDLSESSISEAQLLANAHPALALGFARHDMRDVYQENAFDLIFNLFTSFGYFEDENDDQKVLKAIWAGLKPGGRFVFDFLHAPYVQETFVPSEEKELDGVHFSIARHITESWIVKQISIVDGNHQYRFFEQVRHYQPDELSQMLKKAGFDILRQFGNYQLELPTDDSPRCIFICQKPWNS